jgi:predicted nucleotidyltransferase
MERMKRSSPEIDIPWMITAALREVMGDRLLAIILFGSRARGEASAESDWDVLVIAEGLPEGVFERHLLLKRMLPPDIRGAVSLLAKTPPEFESRLTSLYLDIALDGRVLHDPRGYARKKLAILRQIIKRHGLYRRRTGAGDVWRWRRTPTGPWAVEWG